MTGQPRAIPALTVRQPWAWAIAHAGKDVENRTWRTGYRGPVAIHAGRARPDEQTVALVELLTGRISLPPLAYGAVIAVATLADITRNSGSQWAEPGAWHWHLTNVRPLAEPLPATGRHRLWPTPAALSDRLAPPSDPDQEGR